jgi:hypothetical protein
VPCGFSQAGELQGIYEIGSGRLFIVLRRL